MYDDLEPAGDLLAADGPDDDRGALRFRRVRDLGSVVNVTFRFLRANLREFGRGLLVILGPVVLVTALLNYLAQLSVYDAMASMTPAELNDPFAPFAGMLTPAYGGVILLGLLAPILLTALTYGYVSLYRRGEAGTITPGRMWEAARPLLGPYLGYTALFVGLLVVSAVIAVVPCLGALAWLGGIVYFAPILALVYVARATDHGGLGAAWRRARRLVKGRWGTTFGVLFIAGLLVVIANVVLSIPSSMAGFGIMFSSLSPEPSAGVNRALLAFGALLGTLIYAAYPIPLVAMAFQYGSLVEEEEGATLHARVDAIGAAPPEARARRFEPDAADGFGAWRESPTSAPGPTTSERPTGFRGGGFDDDVEPGTP